MSICCHTLNRHPLWMTKAFSMNNTAFFSTMRTDAGGGMRPKVYVNPFPSIIHSWFLIRINLKNRAKHQFCDIFYLYTAGNGFPVTFRKSHFSHNTHLYLRNSDSDNVPRCLMTASTSARAFISSDK